MANMKEPHPHTVKKPSDLKTIDTLSQQRSAREKSEQQHYPIQDQRKEARRKHTNGSKPANQS